VQVVVRLAHPWRGFLVLAAIMKRVFWLRITLRILAILTAARRHILCIIDLGYVRGVLMRVHLCVFVPCTSSRLVSCAIVFSGNWRCAPALPQLAASEPAGVPSRRGSACCAACGGGLWLVSCARCHASDEVNKGPLAAAL
jgi:hypothetical protein